MASNFEEALIKAQNHISNSQGQVFVIGGASIYSIAICHPNCKGIFLTEISGPVKDGDVFFPLETLHSLYSRNLINELGNELINNSVKNLIFDGNYFYEKDFKYQFAFYHK